VTDSDHESPNPEPSESAPLSRPITAAALLERFDFNLSPEDFLNIDDSRLQEMGNVINTFYQTLPGRLQGLGEELVGLIVRPDLTRPEYHALVLVQNRYNEWRRECTAYQTNREELRRADEEEQTRVADETINRLFARFSGAMREYGPGILGQPGTAEYLDGRINALERTAEHWRDDGRSVAAGRLDDAVDIWRREQAESGLYPEPPPAYGHPGSDGPRSLWRRLLGVGRPPRQRTGEELPPERPPRSLWRRLVGAVVGGERRGSGAEPPPPAYADVATTPGRQGGDVLGTGHTRPAVNEQHDNGAQLDSASGLALPPRYDQAAHTSQENNSAPQEGRRITAHTVARREAVQLQQTAVRQEQHAARSAEENTYGDQETPSR
jgi:hypothetical protein